MATKDDGKCRACAMNHHNSCEHPECECRCIDYLRGGRR